MLGSTALLETAAWLHLLQAPGTWYLARHLVGISQEMKQMSPLVAAIVVVLGASVIVVLVATGLLIALHAEEVLLSSFGRCLSGFLGCFWGARLLIQTWYFHALPWPRTRPGVIAHVALVLVFATQTVGFIGALLGSSR
jgi:hypothetical protein